HVAIRADVRSRRAEPPGPLDRELTPQSFRDRIDRGLGLGEPAEQLRRPLEAIPDQLWPLDRHGLVIAKDDREIEFRTHDYPRRATIGCRRNASNPPARSQATSWRSSVTEPRPRLSLALRRRRVSHRGNVRHISPARGPRNRRRGGN